jgi:class 3 adenylate cyclase
MPLYLDIHKLADNVTPDDIQQAHVKDVEAQSAHGVCYQGYWYNHPGKTVACLVEGPSKEACIEVHRKAHGLVADLIIEVSPETVQAFLGGATVAPTGEAFLPDGTHDPGVRVLVVTEIANIGDVVRTRGDRAALNLVEQHDRIVRRLATKHGGREVKHTGDGSMLSFVLASAAVQCALEIQRELASTAGGDAAPAIRIGIAAGEPVTQHDSLFGAAVEQARGVCYAAKPGEVLTSASVRDLCAGKSINFASAPTIRIPSLQASLDVARAFERGAESPGQSGRGKAEEGQLSPETVLGGRYIVQREIGRGGMATVYAARDLRHERDVAVKVLRRELSASIGSERFLQEIRVAAKLTHPNIVALHDSGDVDGVLYYVMPYLAGETLREVMGRDKPLPVSRAVEIARRIAVALDHAHRQGIVHRDIKPENIMLLDGEPMILDFGIALALSQAGSERLTSAGLSLGTPTYMSPEQAAGDTTIDARTDVYALGCVVYELIAGEPPFTGSSARMLMARVLTEPPPRIGEARSGVPQHVDEAVTRALAKAPEDRFASAGAFAAALAG